MAFISKLCWVSFLSWQQTMGVLCTMYDVRCTTIIVGKVGLVMNVIYSYGFCTCRISSATRDVGYGPRRLCPVALWNVQRMPSSGPFRIVPKVGRIYWNLDARWTVDILIASSRVTGIILSVSRRRFVTTESEDMYHWIDMTTGENSPWVRELDGWWGIPGRRPLRDSYPQDGWPLID